MIYYKLVKCQRGVDAGWRIFKQYLLFFVFLSLSAVTAQSDHRLAGTSSSVPTTQCQEATADPESVADHRRGSRKGGGEVGMSSRGDWKCLQYRRLE